MKGVDVNALLADLMKKLPGNLQLANAIFGAKQGGRIATALGDPEVLQHLIDEITVNSENYAERIATERMSGFDGAVSRLEGSLKNLQTAIGRAWDANGAGGPLTTITDMAGKLVQSFAELNSHVLRAASRLTAIGAA
jgi:hypothetical protein